MSSHRTDQALLEQAHVALRAGRGGVADVAGRRLELRNVVVNEGRVLGLAAGVDALDDETRGTDLRGNLRLQPGHALGDLDVWLVGRWHRISTVEILSDAYAWLPHVPAVALMDPRQWIDQATVLALEVTCGTLRQAAGESPPRPVLHLSDAQMRLLLTD